MNGVKEEAGKRVAQPANPRSGAVAIGGSTSQDLQRLAGDAKKLASVLQENRAKLNQGWKEVNRLDELLNKMDQLLASQDAKLRLNAKDAPPPATPVPRATERPSVLAGVG